MPAPTLNFVPRGPGWPGYRNPVTGQPGTPGQGMGDMFTMDQLAMQPGANGQPGAAMQDWGAGNFLAPGMLAPGYGQPLDLSTAYGMGGLGACGPLGCFGGFGAVDPAAAGPMGSMGRGRGLLKIALAVLLGAGTCYYFCKK